LIEKLEVLCQKAFNEYPEQYDYAKEKISLSMDIRITVVSLIRCMVHYGQHLGGFVKDPKQLPRITYVEKQSEIELT
jgi:hypothetical protein